MTPYRRQMVRWGVAGLGASLSLPTWANPQPTAAASAFPSKPIRLVVPFPAGGFIDALARHLGQSVSAQLGQPVIVDNRPGVGGSLGASLVAKAEPDGHTLLITLSSLLPAASVLYRKLKFNPQTDLVNVSEVAMMNAAWVVNSGVPVNSVRELIAHVKTRPDALGMGSQGPGTPAHVAQHILASSHGARLLHVPYQGEPPLMQDLLAGRVHVAIVSGVQVAQHKASGKLRCIGIGGRRRSTLVPDVPTLGEQGFREEAWLREGPTAVFAPRGTAPALMQRLGEAFKAAAQTPQVVSYLQAGGLFAHGNLPAQAQANFDSYYAVVRQSTAATGVVLD